MSCTLTQLTGSCESRTHLLVENTTLHPPTHTHELALYSSRRLLYALCMSGGISNVGQVLNGRTLLQV